MASSGSASAPFEKCDLNGFDEVIVSRGRSRASYRGVIRRGHQI
jgi:hypothetical protein